MGINLLYEMSRRGLQAAQSGINTAGQNIANAETEGFTRRRITQASNEIPSVGYHSRAPYGEARGAGVSVATYERLRDNLLAAASWRAQTAFGAGDEENRLLTAVEGVFGMGTDGALTNVVSAYWNAWADVADQPTDPGARRELLTRAETMALTIKRTDADLLALGKGAFDQLRGGIDEANSLMHEIADLNSHIREARSNGTPDLSAEDRRDLVVKELSQYVPLQVQDNPDGYMLTIDGMIGVQGDVAIGLRLVDVPSTPPDPLNVKIQWDGISSVDFKPSSGNGGRLGALLNTATVTIPDIRSQLSTFVGQMISDTNTRHVGGFDLNGAAGTALFGGSNASNISVLLTDPRKIAAAGALPGPPPVSAGPGDSATALNILGARNTFEGGVITLLSEIGGKAKAAMSQATAQAALADHLDGLEQGVSGVSLDEEMTRLIQYQQAFAASAKVLTTTEEMMDTLLSL